MSKYLPDNAAYCYGKFTIIIFNLSPSSKWAKQKGDSDKGVRSGMFSLSLSVCSRSFESSFFYKQKLRDVEKMNYRGQIEANSNGELPWKVERSIVWDNALSANKCIDTKTFGKKPFAVLISETPSFHSIRPPVEIIRRRA
ncbi:hypothetical protein CDAR_567981 [Caerostris darwini]|uniref:Uncharacterized protein n=1 Tax=Caerostris darwini TaxID=1538125 RepID=A0AAV4R877_9ARAC|nr:hypothetical protein CDAR_567981 [Caerostris darwini]